MTGLNANVQKALMKIGASNGTAVPDYNIPRGVNDKAAYVEDVKALHELAIADILRSVSKKRHEVALQTVITRGLAESGANTQPGPMVQLSVRGPHTLTLKVNAPSVRLDPALLRAKLSLLIGADKAAKLIAECTKEAAAPRQYRVLTS